MAEATTAANDTANVSTGKGVKGGYFFSVEATAANLAKISSGDLAALDSKITTLYPTAKNLGYISEDGWKISEDRSTNDFNDVNGDLVDSGTSAYSESISATLIEKKADSLKEIYGQDNVTDTNGVIRALHTGDDAPTRIYIAELVLKNGRRWRYIVPLGKVVERGEESIAANSLVGREIKIKGASFAFADGKSVTSIDYIESTETVETVEG